MFVEQDFQFERTKNTPAAFRQDFKVNSDYIIQK